MKEMDDFNAGIAARELMRQYTDHTALRDAADNLIGAGWTADDAEDLRDNFFSDAKEHAAEIGYDLTDEDMEKIELGFRYLMKCIK